VGNRTLILPGSEGRPASELDTDTLRRSAAARASAGLGLNLGNLARLDDMPLPGVADPERSGELLGTVEAGSDALLERALGVGEANARIEREGDTITVDPDDARLCANDPDASYDDGLADLYSLREDERGSAPIDDGLSDCRRLVTDLTVRLDAQAEDAGVITYLFDREPVLAVGYSPGGSVLELDLAGLRAVLQRIVSITAGGDGSDGVPSTMRGTLRLEARVFDDAEGAESGALELRVTEAIAIADESSASEISLAPSRVLFASADAATGRASLGVDWGALRLVAETDEASDGGVLSSVRTLTLGALTFELEASEGATVTDLRNIGFGDTPLNVEVGGVDALSLVLDTFGMSIDDATGALTFDTALGVRLAIDNLTGLLEELPSTYRATFEAAAPAGTRLLELESGATRVEAGGPVTASLIESDASGSTQRELSAGVGTCFDSATERPCD